MVVSIVVDLVVLSWFFWSLYRVVVERGTFEGGCWDCFGSGIYVLGDIYGGSFREIVF